MPHVPTELNRITPHIWIGTNQCCGMHAKALMRRGFEADIDLEAERNEDVHVVPGDIALWLPTRDHAAPHLDQLRVGVAAIHHLVAMKRKIYVHCKNGHGRAPTLVAAYLMSRGMTVDTAIATIKRSRPSIHLEANQRQALEKFKKICKKIYKKLY
jgi:protein-tyrosine phosphatase